jgi:hypothetical protein
LNEIENREEIYVKKIALRDDELQQAKHSLETKTRSSDAKLRSFSTECKLLEKVV